MRSWILNNALNVEYKLNIKRIPYYRKLTLHEIKVLEINATLINANLMEKNFRIKKINAKDEVEFHNKGN